MLIEDYLPVAGGIISMEGYPDQREQVTVRSTNVIVVPHRVSHAVRETRAGHRGGVFWFTGLSGAGKSTLAMEVEQRLFAKGFNSYVLDGDNVRRGLNGNLGFSARRPGREHSPGGRSGGPFRRCRLHLHHRLHLALPSDRERARRAAEGEFHEIYVRASLAVCERRDPKGLYRRARAGEIKDFTGVSAPYEPPAEPELTVDTSKRGVEECVAEIMAYVERVFPLDRRAK